MPRFISGDATTLVDDSVQQSLNTSSRWRRKAIRIGSLFALSLSIAFSASSAAPTDTGISVTEAATLLRNHVEHAKFRQALWGIKVVSLDSGETLFEHNAGKLLKPASNAKLFTGALALDRFGPSYRIRTSVYSRTPLRDGAISGDLIVFGRGDFSISARFHEGNYDGLLRPLAKAIAAAGVKKITGDLIGDETYFIGPPLGSGWAWDDLQYYYGAEVSALTIQDNVIDLVFKPGAEFNQPCSIVTKPPTSFVEIINGLTTSATNGSRTASLYRPVGSNKAYLTGKLPINSAPWIDAVPVHDPALWFVTILKEELQREGIDLGGGVRTFSWPEAKPLGTSELVEVTHIESAPLSDLLSKMLKPSQNLYAQLLLLQVGANSPEPKNDNPSTEELGLAELKKFLRRVDIPTSDVRLDEGSGLSRTALVTPNAIVKLLAAMHRHAHGQVFRDSLPIAGVDGTLRNRLSSERVKGNVRAKTGTIRYVNTLSGYLRTGAGENLVFSVMLNAYSPEGPTTARDEVDYIPSVLAKIRHSTAEKK